MAGEQYNLRLSTSGVSNNMESDDVSVVLACLSRPIFDYRSQCDIGVPVLLLLAWVRCAGTVRGLPVKSLYALLIVGHVQTLNPNSTIELCPALF